MDDVRATFETNVFSIMAMCQAFADQLIAARGLIINIASLAAVSPYIFGAVYCASKGAVVSYSRTLRQELRPFGVRVMVSMTGTVKSNTASQFARVLPENSLYKRINDVFQWRLTFSQTNATFPTDVFAKKLVSKALASEVPIWMRIWFGRPDWFWYGGMARFAWIGSWLGEWVGDITTYSLFKLDRLERMLKAEAAAQKKLK
jgi:1-acylglycerone phosphate reductase